MLLPLMAWSSFVVLEFKSYAANRNFYVAGLTTNFVQLFVAGVKDRAWGIVRKVMM